MEKYMSEDRNMCFVTVANKPYQKYVPWFIYFLNRAYPESHKLILLDEKITDNVRGMLRVLHGNYEVREQAFPEYSETDANTIKCLRWLFYESSFDRYDCMSIGDVDMAIYKESPSYMEQHLSHCEQTGLPYSNFVRPAKAGPHRVGGINVIKPREWFAAVGEIIKKYRIKLKQGSIKLPDHGFNEQLLLRIIVESELGKPPPNLSSTYWSSLVSSNHHGTHVRLAEHGGINGLKGANGYLLHKPEVLSAVRTPLFKQLSQMSPEIGRLLKGTARAYETF